MDGFVTCMYMAAAKFWKRTDELNKVEEIVAKALVEIEASATDNKKDISNLLLDSVKEVAV